MPDASSNPSPPPRRPRRWTVLAAGMLLTALSLVVIYTSSGAFLSPLALVVVAAIGLAALLLQIRLRQGQGPPVRAPLGLNVVGIVFAATTVLADIMHKQTWLLLSALGAVVCFAASGIIVLAALRKQRA